MEEKNIYHTYTYMYTERERETVCNNLKLYAVLCSNDKMPSCTSKIDFLEATPAGVTATWLLLHWKHNAHINKCHVSQGPVWHVHTLISLNSYCITLSGLNSINGNGPKAISPFSWMHTTVACGFPNWPLIGSMSSSNSPLCAMPDLKVKNIR